MKMKTSELTGLALDWAVAKCEKVDEYILYESFMSRWTDEEGDTYQYSTDWAQGGSIIEKEYISVWFNDVFFMNEDGDIEREATWCAKNDAGMYEQTGDTPLIASMRCYVASKLGDEVDVPDELKGESNE